MQTTAVIDAIMAAERLPQKELKSKVAKFDKVIKAMQSMNSATKALGDKARDIQNNQFWQNVAATSSSERVSVAAKPTAAEGQLKFDVLSVAQAHTVVGSPVEIDPEAPMPDPASITVSEQAGPPPVLSIASDNPDPRAIAQAINGAGSGYTAQAIQIAPNQYRLQVSSNEAGANSVFSVNVTTNPPMTFEDLRQGTDAVIEFGEGFQATSTDNTFENIVDGVSVTVTKPETGVTIDVKTDTEKIVEDVKGFVEGLNELLSDIKTKTYVAPEGGAGSGVMVGSSVLRGLQMQMSSAATGYAGSGAVYETGIEIDRYGKFEFDEAKFKELLASDPAKAQSIMTALAEKVEAVSDTYSKPSTGILSAQISGKQGQVRGLNDQIEGWDRRLEMREAGMRRQFGAMETMLSKIQSQGNWLAGQLRSM